MPVSWPFTRKRTNIPTLQNLANQKALSAVQQKYGRMGRHSKVANVLFPNEGYHDPFEIERKQLSQKFLEEGQKKAQSITESQKEGIIAWANELKNKIDNVNINGQRGGGKINIDVPESITKVLLFVIGLGLLGCVVFAVFVDIAIVIAGGEAAGLSSILLNNSLLFMNISPPATRREPETFVTVNPIKHSAPTHYRRSRRNTRA